MHACHKLRRRSTSQQAGILAFLPFLLLASCAAAPFLIPAGIEFARNLLVTGNKNFGGKYSEDMNRLMVRLSTPYVAMGLPMGTSPAALVPPAMLQQQQQAMMGQMGDSRVWRVSTEQGDTEGMSIRTTLPALCRARDTRRADMGCSRAWGMAEWRGMAACQAMEGCRGRSMAIRGRWAEMLIRTIPTPLCRG